MGCATAQPTVGDGHAAGASAPSAVAQAEDQRPPDGPPVVGIASYYGRAFAGRPTASGEIFDPSALTMAHPRWPFGTTVRVTHLGNGLSVVVRVNDRGPAKPGRVADVSLAAARALGMVREGLARVRLERLAANP
jgi:rare lipoprotein A